MLLHNFLNVLVEDDVEQKLNKQCLKFYLHGCKTSTFSLRLETSFYEQKIPWKLELNEENEMI